MQLEEILRVKNGAYDFTVDPHTYLFARTIFGGGASPTIIEITGIPPLTFIGYGDDLMDYLISGNTLQSGTPTPDMPVDVVGCGVRTENLCSNIAYKTHYSINAQGVEITTNGFNIYSVFCNSNTTYTISLKSPLGGTIVRIHAYTNGEWIEQTKTAPIQNMPMIFTTPNNADEIRVSIMNAANGNVMLNIGSTALPYKPYGFKLPLTVNGTEYPIYLGQVETTRRIKKLVLTGEETWTIDGGKAGLYSVTNESLEITAPIQAYAYQLSSHFVLANSYNTLFYNTGYFAVQKAQLIIGYFAKTSVEAFKSYLADQYAAGTPVTVWYVLAEPETGIVNEPLMKIGDYADTISFAQAGVTIPTVSGANVLDMTSNVKPSEVYIKGKIKAIETEETT